jgi:hypothetical protein
MKARKGGRGINLHTQPWRYKWAGGQRQASAALSLENRAGTHCIGSWVGLEVGLQNFAHTAAQTPDRPAKCLRLDLLNRVDGT